MLPYRSGISWLEFRNCLRNPLDGTEEVACARAEEVALSEIPRHRNGLARKRKPDEAARSPGRNAAPGVGQAINGEAQVDTQRFSVCGGATTTLSEGLFAEPHARG